MTMRQTKLTLANGAKLAQNAAVAPSFNQHMQHGKAATATIDAPAGTGRWQTWSANLLPVFSSGPAHLAEDVTAAGNWWRHTVQKLTEPTILTPFQVVGSNPATA